MGNEVYVYARAGAHALVARVVPQPLPEAGAALDLAFDLSKIHLFDGASGDSLAARGDAPAMRAA